MTLLQDIISAALLGTERQPFTSPTAPGALGELLARLPGDSEAALLGAAAAVSLARRTGTLPVTIDADRLELCPADDQPVCAAPVTQGFVEMLSGSHREALPEMLTALAATGKRVPETLLPELLKAGRQQKDLRNLILPVLGRRGRWLAAQNRDWAFADQLALEMAVSPDQIWQEGSREARRALLEELRRTAPTQALTLLQSTWATETADDRAVFLAALEAGLSLDDEPFLEAALDDRGKDVRRAAAQMLARLQESQFVKRMIARAEPLLAWKQKLLRPAEIEVSLPEACDAAMSRDGITSNPPFAALGEKAWWLAQILAAVPLNHWTRKWNRTPAQVLEATLKNEWRQALLTGWQNALIPSGDPEWVLALTRFYLTQKIIVPTEISAAWQSLSHADLESLLREALHTASDLLQDQSPLLTLMREDKRTWSIGLSRDVIGHIRQRTAQENVKDQRLWSLTHLLRDTAAYQADPSLVEEFSYGWPEDAPQWEFWQPHVHQFLSTLHFRYDLLKEIRL